MVGSHSVLGDIYSLAAVTLNRSSIKRPTSSFFLLRIFAARSAHRSSTDPSIHLSAQAILNFRPVEKKKEEEDAVASPGDLPMTLATFLSAAGVIADKSGNSTAAENAAAEDGWSSEEKCRCRAAPDIAELVVRRYPLTEEDFDAKKGRYSEVGLIGRHSKSGLDGEINRLHRCRCFCCFVAVAVVATLMVMFVLGFRKP